MRQVDNMPKRDTIKANNFAVEIQSAREIIFPLHLCDYYQRNERCMPC